MSAVGKLARTAGWALLAAVGTTLLTVILIALVVVLLGGDARAALAAIYKGSIGSPDAVTETLIRATPLVFTGLSVAVAFRCGIFNIGAEGQFVAGMLGATVTALALPPLPQGVAVALTLLGGALFGLLWALPPALLKLRRSVPEVISTIMLNFLAVYLVQYLVRGPMRDPQSVDDWSRRLPPFTRLPRLGEFLTVSPEYARLHIGIALALLAAVLVGVWLFRTGSGFRLRAVGLSAEAAASAGIPVARTVLVSFIVSGALAGFGGAVEQMSVIARLHRYGAGEPGYGFSGIAVALLGQLHPAGVLLSGIFFGALAAGSKQMERSASVSYHVAYIIQAVVVLMLISLPANLRSFRFPWTVKLAAVTKTQAVANETVGTDERNGGS